LLNTEGRRDVARSGERTMSDASTQRVAKTVTALGNKKFMVTALATLTRSRSKWIDFNNACNALL
jgi:hypothetical protein